MRSQQLLAGGRVPGNREVSRYLVFGGRGDTRGAGAEACPEEEGGTRGKHGFPRGSAATREEMLRALREARGREREEVEAPVT
jgi:hypothetical protein